MGGGGVTRDQENHWDEGGMQFLRSPKGKIIGTGKAASWFMTGCLIVIPSTSPTP